MLSFRADAGPALCANRHNEVHCNWLADDHDLCRSCRMSRIIPGQHIADNRERWRRLERAKRALVRQLLALGLPVDPARLSFEFKEDQRTNEAVAERHVATGHYRGVITINAAESDDVFREQMRAAMHEPYRTLLGHMRHESGHYYFPQLVSGAALDEARRVFGDERQDYSTALESYYANGPHSQWRERFISAYASAHPAEDWAESWAHFLHLSALLERAEAESFVAPADELPWPQRVGELIISLNELNRSLGLPDAYPFLLTPEVITKINFVRRIVRSSAAAGAN